MQPLHRPFPPGTLADFALALWGACVGSALVALVLNAWILGSGELNTTAHPAIAAIPIYEAVANVPWAEAFERRMYLLHSLVCPGLAWLAIVVLPRRCAWACAAAAALFVPAITYVYAGVFQADPQWTAFAGVALILGVPPLAWGIGGRLAWRRAGAPTVVPAIDAPGSVAEASEPVAEAAAPAPRRRLALLLVGLVLFFYLPLRVDRFADTLAMNVHVCTWMVAPALAYLAPQSTPGLDFEAHYGVGNSYCFSFLLGNSRHSTLLCGLGFLFGLNLFFFVTAYFTMSNVLRSARAAFLATVILAAVCMEGESYGYPSNWPVRFPLLFVFIGCAAQEDFGGRRWLPAALAGLLAGASTFWQSDIGVHLVLAGTVYYATLVVCTRRAPGRAILFALTAAATFAGLCVLAFGAPALTWAFYWSLAEPLLLYANGFAFRLMRWEAGWTYLYNVIAPMVALATAAWAVHEFRAPERSRRVESHFLFLCSCIGMLFLLKWVNRSIDIVWSINAAPIVIVLVWWGRYAAMALGERVLAARLRSAPEDARDRLRVRWGISACAVVVGLGLLASVFHDPDGIGPGFSSSPLVRLTRFTRITPTAANYLSQWLLRTPPPSLDAGRIDPDDVAFLRANSEPTEPVAILALNDWWYLADARRPPRFALLPAYWCYSKSLINKIESDVRRSRTLFVDRTTAALLREINPPLYDRLRPILEREFTLIGSGPTLDLYQRRPEALAAQ